MFLSASLPLAARVAHSRAKLLAYVCMNINAEKIQVHDTYFKKLFVQVLLVNVLRVKFGLCQFLNEQIMSRLELRLGKPGVVNEGIVLRGISHLKAYEKEIHIPNRHLAFVLRCTYQQQQSCWV